MWFEEVTFPFDLSERKNSIIKTKTPNMNAPIAFHIPKLLSRDLVSSANKRVGSKELRIQQVK